MRGYFFRSFFALASCVLVRASARYSEAKAFLVRATRRQFPHPQTLFLACLCSLFWLLSAHGQEAAPSATPTLCHVDSTFVQTLYGKSQGEILALIGWPGYAEAAGMIYPAKVPTLLGEADGHLLIRFARNKARVFQLHTEMPLNNTFVRLVLQNSPGARFEPSYHPENLTGTNWEDKRAGFQALTTQVSEHEFLFLINMTPSNEHVMSSSGQNKARH